MESLSLSPLSPLYRPQNQLEEIPPKTLIWKRRKTENIQISSQSSAKVNGINTAFEHGYLAEIREQHGADVRDSLYNRSLMCLPFSFVVNV